MIIDRLKDPKVFSTSSKILGEFKKYFPDTTVEFAYSLARGGIAIHLYTQEERDNIISTFPVEAFGGGTLVHPPKGDKDPDIFIKEVDTSIDTGLLRY